MSKTIYRPNGKCSRAWYLELVQKHGDGSIKAICLAGGIQGFQARSAVAGLVEDGMVNYTGQVGRGRTPVYFLTVLGEHYLEMNQDELKGGVQNETPPTVSTKRAAVFTWRRVLGGAGTKFFADGKMIASSLIPDVELARMRDEMKDGGFGQGTDAKQGMQTVPSQGKYTWKKPEAGPVKYYFDGEFILETRIPNDELQRMLTEQGSPLSNIAPPNTYRVDFDDRGNRIYFINSKQVDESEMPDEQLKWMRTWEAPKDGDIRLKPTKRPKNPDDLDDDELGDEPGRSIPKPKTPTAKYCQLMHCCAGTRPLGHPNDNGKVGSILRPLDRVVDKAITLGQEIEKHDQTNYKRTLPLSTRTRLTDDDMEPMPDDFLETPAERVAKGIAIAEHVLNNGGVPVDDTQHGILGQEIEIHRARDKNAAAATAFTRPMPPLPDNISALQKIDSSKLVEQPALAELLLEAINDILYQRYASTITALEVLEWLKNN